MLRYMKVSNTALRYTPAVLHIIMLCSRNAVIKLSILFTLKD